jgi:UDP:flavonoid glycosyltransferase YjiC (YdhE family)
MARSFGSLAWDYAESLSAPYLQETDLLINQLPGGLFGSDLAQRAGVPMIMAAVIPLARTKAFPMMGFPVLSLPIYNRATYEISEIVVWLMFKKVINRWRTQHLGLPKLTRKAYFGQQGTGGSLIINGFSPTVVERPPDWGEHIHITGYWFPEDPGWQPPPELVKFIESGQPPIFIGFGSMPVKDPLRTSQIILEAIKETKQRAVLHTGWSGLGNLELPEDVFKINYAPYSWLFPRMAMAIHHGGSGTTGFALRAGVPSCAVPLLGFDQIYWGKRIATLGAGPAPLPMRKLTVKRLREVILQGVNSKDIRDNAAALGEKIREEKGIHNAVKIINQHLEK